MLVYDIQLCMEDEMKTAPDANKQGQLPSKSNESAGHSVSKSFAFHSMWQNVFNKLSIFGDSDPLQKNKSTRLLENEIKINPNWPLRDGDL